MATNDQKVIRLAILASGSGSNAESLMGYFAKHPLIRIQLLISDKPDCGAVQKARAKQVPTAVLSLPEWNDEATAAKLLKENRIDGLLLAGFLRLLPEWLVRSYRGKILNIHPSLLPAYGGKGMYGIRVHRAVVEAGEPYSGLSIHEVNENFDEGRVIYQEKVDVPPGCTAEELQALILKREHMTYALIAESFFLGSI
jgi:phosphoribosylglycinamide formyltransferase-1